MINDLNLILGTTVILLIFVSSFFSLVETSLTTCSKAKIHRLAKDGDPKAIKVEILLKKSESAISTILLCNNAINILASSIATSVFINLFGQAGIIYVTLIMTILVVVFGEIAPKTYSLKNAEKIILFSTPFILFLVKIFNPITKNVQHFIEKVFYLFKSNKTGLKKTTNLISDLEEIRGTIDLKHKAGSIVKYEKDMLDSILDLGEMQIANIMVHRKNIISINIEQSLDQILKIAFKINHGKIPLWQGNEDNIVAILNMRKLINILHLNHGDINKISLSECTSVPWFIPSSNTLKSQLISFRYKKEKFAIVIDEYGALMGIITMEDILEEIVGELEEEEDSRSKTNQSKPKIIKCKDNSYKIYGELPIRDINRKLSWNLPEDDEDASTLAGLLIARAERIPEEKEEFKFDGFTFKVLKIQENKIGLMMVKKLEPKA
jgi:Mg2+/Co2+ transporter CorB